MKVPAREQLPITVSLTINNPATLAGFGGITTADYTLTATQPLAVTGTILVTCNSDQGTPAVLEFDVTITPAVRNRSPPHSRIRWSSAPSPWPASR